MNYGIGKNNGLNSLSVMCLVAGVPSVVFLGLVFFRVDDYVVVDYFAKSAAGIWLMLNITTSLYGFVLLFFFQDKIQKKENRLKLLLPFFLTAVTGVAVLFLAYNDQLMGRLYWVILIPSLLLHLLIPFDILVEVKKKSPPKFLKFYNVRNKKILIAISFLLYAIVSCSLYFVFILISFQHQNSWNLYWNLEIYFSTFGLYGGWLFFNAAISLYLGIFLFQNNEYIFKKRLFVYIPIFIIVLSGIALFIVSFWDKKLSIAPTFLIFPLSIGSLSMYFLLKKHFNSLKMGAK